MKRRRGFSLAELAVYVAVASVWAGLVAARAKVALEVGDESVRQIERGQREWERQQDKVRNYAWRRRQAD